MPCAATRINLSLSDASRSDRLNMSQPVRAKNTWHFLIDEDAAGRIVGALDANGYRDVVEIGQERRNKYLFEAGGHSDDPLDIDGVHHLLAQTLSRTLGADRRGGLSAMESPATIFSGSSP